MAGRTVARRTWAGRSRKSAAVAVAVSVLASLGVVGSRHAAEAASGADVVEACAPATALPEIGPRACSSVQAGVRLAAQMCRRAAPLHDAVCPAVDGHQVTEAAMVAFETSWLARALALQRGLDRNVPLSQSLIPHTHNSANSAAYAPSLTGLDANQVLTITDQLRLGMRAIELDVHWVPNPHGDPAHGMRAVVQCHGEPVPTPAGNVHAGCSIDTPLVDLLRELRTWLEASPTEVVLLYLENVLDGDPAAHAAAVQAIEGTIGDLVDRPVSGGGCQSLPVARTAQQILDADHQVLITGNCGPTGAPAGGWDDWVFDRYPSWNESGGSTFDCSQARAAIPTFDSILVRRYEDSTWLSAMAGSGSHLDAATISAMVQCGVNLVGFDQLTPDDDRLPGLVWSWRTNEPAVGGGNRCAAQGADGRFFADACNTPRPVACRTATGWTLSATSVRWTPQAASACPASSHFDVPVNGWDNAQLRAAAGGQTVWLAYHRVGQAWVTATS